MRIFPAFSIGSADEGLKFETSAFKFLYGGQFINPVDKTIFVFHTFSFQGGSCNFVRLCKKKYSCLFMSNCNRDHVITFINCISLKLQAQHPLSSSAFTSPLSSYDDL